MEKQEFERLAIPIPESGCWLWEKSWASTGYGQARKDKTTYGAHRMSYEIYKGDIPEGLCVMHTCDTRACVNPEHLVLGTKGDNNRDAFNKDRQTILKGTERPSAKLDDDKVRYIRTQKGIRTNKDLGREFGVDPSIISEVQNRKIWSHVD